MALIIIWLLCGVVSAGVAASKGRSGSGFFLLGVLLGPLGLLGAGVASPDRAKQDGKATRAGLQSGALRRCPHCAEAIQRDAKVCPHCQRDVPPPPARDIWGREIPHS